MKKITLSTTFLLLFAINNVFSQNITFQNPTQTPSANMVQPNTSVEVTYFATFPSIRINPTLEIEFCTGVNCTNFQSAMTDDLRILDDLFTIFSTIPGQPAGTIVRWRASAFRGVGDNEFSPIQQYVVTNPGLQQVISAAGNGNLSQEDLSNAGVEQEDLTEVEIGAIEAAITGFLGNLNSTEDLQQLVDTALEEFAVAAVVEASENNMLTQALLTAAGVTQTNLTDVEIDAIEAAINETMPAIETGELGDGEGDGGLIDEEEFAITPTTTEDLQFLVNMVLSELDAVSAVLAAEIGSLTQDLLRAANISPFRTTFIGRLAIQRALNEGDTTPITTEDLQAIVDAVLPDTIPIDAVVSLARDSSLTQQLLTDAGITQTNLTELQIERIQTAISIIPFGVDTPTSTEELQVIVDAVLEEVAVEEVVTAAEDSNLTQVLLTDAGITQTSLTDMQLNAIQTAVNSATEVPETTADLQEIADAVIAEFDAVAAVVEAAERGDLTIELLSAANIDTSNISNNQVLAIETALDDGDIEPFTIAELQAVVDAALEEFAPVAIVITSSEAGNLTFMELTDAGFLTLSESLTEQQLDTIEAAINTADPIPTSASELQFLVDIAIQQAAIDLVVTSSEAGTLTAMELGLAGIASSSTLTVEQLDVIEAEINVAEIAPTTTADLEAILDDLLEEFNRVEFIVINAESGTLSQEELAIEGLIPTQTNLTDEVLEEINVAIATANPTPIQIADLQTIVDTILEQAAIAVILMSSEAGSLTQMELADAGILITKATLTDEELDVIEEAITTANPVPNTIETLQNIVEEVLEEFIAVAAVVRLSVGDGELTQEALTAAGITETELTEASIEAIQNAIIQVDIAPTRTADLQDIVDATLITLSVNDVALGGITLSPNPAENVIYLNGLESSDFKASIYSVLGTLVKTSANVKTITISNLKAGVYILRLDTPAGSTVKRFIRK